MSNTREPFTGPLQAKNLTLKILRTNSVIIINQNAQKHSATNHQFTQA